MASTRIIEEERGTYTGQFRRHNGYWAGEFPATHTAGPTRPAPLSWR